MGVIRSHFSLESRGSPILTYLIFPHPPLFAVPNGVLEPAKTFPFMATPHSDANWVMPIISQLILTIATSSASPELRVTFFWVADHVLRVCRPLQVAPPLVLLAVVLQPGTRSSRRFGGARRGNAQASGVDGGHLGWGCSSPCTSP